MKAVGRSRGTRAGAAVAAVVLLACTATAWADPPRSGDAPSKAQALFYEARDLMKGGKYAVACPKLEESLQLEYGVGTEFNLADCNEKIGKIASAWSGFVNVANIARSQNQPQREKIANERAKSLEGRLPRITIAVSRGAPARLEIKRDGAIVEPTAWGIAIPVDPGVHRITATAPDRQPWAQTVSVSEKDTARVDVPALASTVKAEAPAQPAAVPVVEQRHEASAQPAYFPEPVVERSTTQRTFGWVLAGVGLAGLGTSAGFGIDSIQKRERSKDHCDGNVCDAQGISLRDDAIASGDVATIAGIAGGVVLASGVVLVLTAPSPASRKEQAAKRALRAVPHIAMNGGGVSLQGLLP